MNSITSILKKTNLSALDSNLNTTQSDKIDDLMIDVFSETPNYDTVSADLNGASQDDTTYSSWLPIDNYKVSRLVEISIKIVKISETNN